MSPLRKICLPKRKINPSNTLAGQMPGIREVDDQTQLVSFLD
jgi:hypothetical protein